MTTVILEAVSLCFTLFQALTVASRSPEDPETLLLSGAGWSGETAELLQLDWTAPDWISWTVTLNVLSYQQGFMFNTWFS